MPGMARGIFLERSGIVEGQVGTIQGFRLQVRAHDAEGLPDEIFVYRVQLVDPNAGTQKATFQNIASAADLEELPINGVTEDSPLLFRKDSIDVLFRSPITLDETWELIKKDVAELINTLNKLDILEIIEDVLIGTVSEEVSSSSPSSL